MIASAIAYFKVHCYKNHMRNLINILPVIKFLYN